MQFTKPGHPLSCAYSEILKKRVAAMPKSDRGALRRERILLAATLLLEESGIDAVMITNVVERAETARGTFYLYFKNRHDLLLAMLQDFIDTYFTNMPIPRTSDDWRVKNYLSNLLFAETCMYNVNLMQGLYQKSEMAEQANALHTRKNIEWMPHIYRAHMRVFGPAANAEAQTEIMRELYALRIMAEKTALERYTGQNPELNALFPTPHDLAQCVANVWIRAVESRQSNSSLT